MLAHSRVITGPATTDQVDGSLRSLHAPRSTVASSGLALHYVVTAPLRYYAVPF
ncbi:MAG: hypothetical protein ABIQ13_02575 [Pedococcus sp.]